MNDSWSIACYFHALELHDPDAAVLLFQKHSEAVRNNTATLAQVLGNPAKEANLQRYLQSALAFPVVSPVRSEVEVAVSGAKIASGPFRILAHNLFEVKSAIGKLTIFHASRFVKYTPVSTQVVSL